MWYQGFENSSRVSKMWYQGSRKEFKGFQNVVLGFWKQLKSFKMWYQGFENNSRVSKMCRYAKFFFHSIKTFYAKMSLFKRFVLYIFTGKHFLRCCFHSWTSNFGAIYPKKNRPAYRPAEQTLVPQNRGNRGTVPWFFQDFPKFHGFWFHGFFGRPVGRPIFFWDIWSKIRSSWMKTAT